MNFLVMDKSVVSDEGMVKQIFSHLNVAQIRHLLAQFQPDEYAK